MHNKYNTYFYSEDEIDFVFKTEKDEVRYSFLVSIILIILALTMKRSIA